MSQNPLCNAPLTRAALALACSPRAGGNSDTLATAFAQGFTAGFTGGDTGGLPVDGSMPSALSIQIEHLRNYAIRPCIACYACEPDTVTKESKPCPLGRGSQFGPFEQSDKADGAEHLFHMLMQAPALYMTAPIFFYHVPAHLKAFIDRGQSYWLRRMAGDAELCALPPRPAWVSLVAARKRGDKLFEGSLVSLRFFLQIFNFVLQEPETLLGYDDADAVSRDASMMEQTVAYGQRAAESLRLDTWQR